MRNTHSNVIASKEQNLKKLKIIFDELFMQFSLREMWKNER